MSNSWSNSCRTHLGKIRIHLKHEWTSVNLICQETGRWLGFNSQQIYAQLTCIASSHVDIIVDGYTLGNSIDLLPKLQAGSNYILGFWYFTWSRSREIPRNSLKILPKTCQHNIFESYLGCWGCLLAVNLLICLEASKQHPKLPGIPSVDLGNWGWECNSLFYNAHVLALRVKNAAFCEGLHLFRSSHLQRWRSFSERFGPRMIMPENLQNEQSSCSFSRDNK